MSGPAFAIGFLLGVVFMRLLNAFHPYRKCCEEHFATHPTCLCSSCQAEREGGWTEDYKA